MRISARFDFFMLFSAGAVSNGGGSRKWLI